ncbi:uncharacterized protein EAE98_010830 [Botrytis deweyae]|uniref:RTA1 domain protein n=1 Tax=Botrytis deweyae TaxID=2478750 RepID=A0ABQ7I7V4_9HELO|nr:uncharacterized protein EAE98_010830 [Botrytis deweyae]KAF7916245.1 hypothetical protein EAE98_010830 [Botrytis deweyae]
MGKLLPIHGDYYLWLYVPNIAAASIFALLFAVMMILLSWRMYKTRSWFCGYFIAGCLMEFVGYCARAAAANHTDRIGPYVIQNMFILVAPTLFAATTYMCLGRLIRLVGGEEYSIVNPRKMTAVFVTGDLISFMLQGGSAYPSILSQTYPLWAKITKAMIIGGLAIQVVCFSLFALSAIIFHKRIRRYPTARSCANDVNWLQSLYMLYCLSLLIFIRSVFRLVEYSLGKTALSSEWTLYIFDTVPMFLVTVFFFFRYPGNLASKAKDWEGLELQVGGEPLVAGSK